jgi:hypothetical protein
MDYGFLSLLKMKIKMHWVHNLHSKRYALDMDIKFCLHFIEFIRGYK